MEDDAPIIYGLELQARALASQVAETEAIRFLVGTQSLKCDNQVHLLDVDDENNIINKSVYLHRLGEVWHISSSPKDRDVIATCYTKAVDSKCQEQSSIWKLPLDCEASSVIEDNSATPSSLELLCDLNDSSLEGDTKCVLWRPSDGQSVVTLVDNYICLFDLAENATQAKVSARWTVDVKGHLKLSTGAWNPHQNCTQISTANDSCIRGWDVRSQKQIYAIENAHGTLVRDLTFNPNKQYHFASCGDDCKVKFWDYRYLNEPLKIIDNHSHWVWCVRFNHFHDQLVLSSSSDSRVILHNVASISSEPLGHLNEDDANSEGSDDENRQINKVNEDGVIATFEEHEDSVYAVEWSMADPWLFASLSYDGRLIINKVPKTIKYKILL